MNAVNLRQKLKYRYVKTTHPRREESPSNSTSAKDLEYDVKVVYGGRGRNLHLKQGSPLCTHVVRVARDLQ